MKVTTSVFVDKQILEDIKNNPRIKNLSQWINTKYYEEFMPLEKETAYLTYLCKEVEKCKERIRIIRKAADGSMLPKAALNWIKTFGANRVKRGFAIESVLRYFNRNFNQNLNLRQFKIYMKK